MQRHCDNALAVARWLKRHPKVAWVNYAGLEDDPCYGLHRTYCPKGAGAVFTFGVKGGYEAGVTLVNSVQAVQPSRQCRRHAQPHHPSGVHHASPVGSDEQQKAAGAGDEVVRLSIGIESLEDIIADLDQALNAG